MDWFRHYHGLSSDPKLRLVARSASVPTPFAIAAWCALLEHASSHDDRGSVEGMSAELLAMTVDIAEDDAERLLAGFRKRGMITTRVLAWERRQVSSDSSAERTKRWRERKALADCDTSRDVTCDDVTSRTEQSRTEQIREDKKDISPSAPAAVAAERKPKRKPVGYSDEFERYWQVFPVRDTDGKADCWKLWKAAINRGEDAENILRHAAEYRSVWLGNEFRIGARRYLRNEEWRKPVPVPTTSVVPFNNAQPSAKSPLEIHRRVMERFGIMESPDDDTGNGGGYLALAH